MDVVSLLRCRLVVFIFVVLCNICESRDDDNAEDYDIEEDYQGAIKEELQTLSDWLLNEGKDKVPEYNLCPPPVKPLSASACSAPRCVENIDCKPKNNDTYLCCFNGCVETCMRALDPPSVFDWIEEPPEPKKIILAERTEHAHARPPEAVALPGGCVITPKQYMSLEGFKENKFITDCFCDIGGVFCKVAER